MPLFTTDLLELDMLNHRILRDVPPPRIIDAICFFGQTQENDQIALKSIIKRWEKYNCPILIGACDRIEKGSLIVRGSDDWVIDLKSAGVKPKWIWVYNMSSKFPPSTDAEAYGMVEVIEENSWNEIVITVPPLHARRAFVSLVSACQKSGLRNVKIWSVPSEAPPWDEDVFHSGSMPSAPREKQIAGEFGKVFTYCAKGDHLTAKEVLEYLRNRKGLE